MNPYAAPSNAAVTFVQPGETVVWTGRPPMGLRLRATDAIYIPFSLMWAGFAFVWEGAAVRSGPFFFEIFGVPFVLVGIYLVVGRFFIDAWLRAATWYAVTDRAAYIARVGRFAAVRRFGRTALDAVELQPATNGIGGTIRFQPLIASYVRTRNASENMTSLNSFEGLADARDVYAKLVAIRDTPAAASTN